MKLHKFALLAGLSATNVILPAASPAAAQDRRMIVERHYIYEDGVETHVYRETVPEKEFLDERYADDGEFLDSVEEDGLTAHIRWCDNRYRSYNPHDNSWVTYSGKVKQCISPYT